MKKIFLLVFFLSVGITSWAQKVNENSISIEEFKQAIKSDSSLVILDVRTSEELEGHLGKIENIINLPLQQLKEKIHELDKFKGKNIAVICLSGYRSSIAAGILKENGFNAKSVDGGMQAYRENERER